jgi:Domain of unknown function (DUF5916)/Carbohydrate family 9 binding domain-like
MNTDKLEKTWHRLTLVTIIILKCSGAYTQNIFMPDSVKKKIQATRIETNITIDGKLNEPEWSQAYIVNNFTQADPVQGAKATRNTIVRLLYNNKYLYVSALCYDTVGKNKYRVLNLKRDYRASQNDFFAFAIDGYNDERNCAMFMLNPYGAQRDLLSFDDYYYEPDWDGLWMGRTQRTDTAWIAEFAIPWKTLRYKNSSNSFQTWGISFARLARTINETSYFPAFPRAYGGLRMPYAAKLVNLNVPHSSFNLRVQPYILYSHNEQKENGTKISSKNSFKPGVDAKWAINSNTLLDLTFNTDFAQADVDRKVNNINRFSIFFPERRQFFLENNGVFAAGQEPLSNDFSEYSTRIQPFFSRTIGLDGNGMPLNIEAGARMVYRTDKRSAGGLFIRQQGNNTTNPANFFVGRYSQNFNKQNRIGALVSYKMEDAKINNSGTKNLTATIDGFLRFTQSLSWSFMASTTSGFNNKNGYAAASKLLYNSNKWTAWWNESFVSDKYNPQMGFVSRANFIVTDAGVILQKRGIWLPKFIRAFTPGISITTYHNFLNAKLTDRYLNISPLSFQLQNGGNISWYTIFTRQKLESNFSPLRTTISSGVYNYVRHKIQLSSDQSKKVAAILIANLGTYYNGSYNSLSTTVTIAPLPYFYISPSLEIGKLKKVGITNTTKDVKLYSLEGRLALNPRMQLSALYQKYNVFNTVDWNLRFSWEFKPLSYVYLVYNTNRVNELVKTDNRVLIAKVSYIRQF